jgi:hypothetical protein
MGEQEQQDRDNEMLSQEQSVSDWNGKDGKQKKEQVRWKH